MADFLESDCPKCGTPYLSVTACSAVDDQSLIDLVVRCDECGHTLNAFIYLAEMTEVTPNEDPTHG